MSRLTLWATFAQRWRSAVATVPERTFLIFEASDGRVTEWTYAEADALVARVVGGLRELGVESGSAVQLVHTNSTAFVMTWLACAQLGATIVPSDPRATDHEVAEHARRTRPVVVICHPERADGINVAVAAAAVQATVVGVDPDDADLDDLAVDASSAGPLGGIEPTTRLAVMFTSGTTSAPKGVEVSQGLYAFTGDVMAAMGGLTRFDRQFVVLPMFHANAQYYSFCSAISVGASVALMSSFSASRFVEQARRHNATHASLFAAPIRMIVARTPPDSEPLSLRNAWFAQNLSSHYLETISTLLGCELRQIYGMTETGPAVLVNPAVGARPAAIGRPTLGCDVRVVDSANQPVGVGGSGALQVNGFPGHTIFTSYLDDAATTGAAFVEEADDGSVWFDTGDRASIDELGFYYFDGRRSDVLKVGGENVSIVEVEQSLAEHPAVDDVAVVGAHDDVLDEVPVAYVVTNDDADEQGVERALRDWAAQRLAPSKQPRAYHFRNELPRTSVGKIRKFLLTAEASDSGRQPTNERKTT